MLILKLYHQNHFYAFYTNDNNYHNTKKPVEFHLSGVSMIIVGLITGFMGKMGGGGGDNVLWSVVSSVQFV